jgi:hypothetical protein
VPSKKRGRTALVEGDRCATQYPRVLSCVERGTGLDHRASEFSPVGLRDHGAGLVALSSLALSISVRLQGVLASHRIAFKTESKMRLFQGQSSHFVPFRLIHFYLFGACESCLGSWSAECRRGGRGTRHFGFSLDGRRNGARTRGTVREMNRPSRTSEMQDEDEFTQRRKGDQVRQ